MCCSSGVSVLKCGDQIDSLAMLGSGWSVQRLWVCWCACFRLFGQVFTSTMPVSPQLTEPQPATPTVIPLDLCLRHHLSSFFIVPAGVSGIPIIPKCSVQESSFWQAVLAPARVRQSCWTRTLLGLHNSPIHLVAAVFLLIIALQACAKVHCQLAASAPHSCILPPCKSS